MAAKIKEQILLQYQGQEADVTAITATIKQAWKDAGNKVSDIATLNAYVKPEEGMIYYVINDSQEGKVALF